MRRYPISKGRETPARWMVLEWWLRGAGATLKRYAMSKGKEKPQQVGRWSKMAFKIKPHTRQRCSEGSNKSCVHQDPETPTETETELCLSVSYGVWVSSGLPQGQGLWVQQTQVQHEPSWRRSSLSIPELTQDWRNRLLEGTNRTLCAPEPRRKEQ